MSKWFADGFKIACGICVGYGLLFVYGAVFEFVVMPVAGLFMGK